METLREGAEELVMTSLYLESETSTENGDRGESQRRYFLGRWGRSKGRLEERETEKEKSQSHEKCGSGDLKISSFYPPTDYSQR